MSPAITSPKPVTATRCVACDTAMGPHDCADYTVPVTHRATITATVRTVRPLHEYLPLPGENNQYPAI